MGRHKGIKEIWSLCQKFERKISFLSCKLSMTQNVLKGEEGGLNWGMSQWPDGWQTWAMEVQIPAKYMLHLCQCATIKPSIMYGNVQEIIIIKQKGINKIELLKISFAHLKNKFPLYSYERLLHYHSSR